MPKSVDSLIRRQFMCGIYHKLEFVKDRKDAPECFLIILENELPRFLKGLNNFKDAQINVYEKMIIEAQHNRPMFPVLFPLSENRVIIPAQELDPAATTYVKNEGA